MPVPAVEAITEQAEAGATTVALARSSMGRYLARAAMSGAAVGAVVVLLISVSSPLIVAKSPFTRLVEGASFGVAFALVLLAGAELFTGSASTTLFGVARGTVDVADAVLVWIAALIGNVVGAVALAFVVDAAGLLTAGGPVGQPTSVHKGLGAIALGMGDLDGGQLFLRAVLCNLLLCAAIWTAARAASSGAKLVVLAVAVLTFVTTGLELSVANLATLSLAALSDVGTWGELSRNLTFTVPGNLVGAAAFVLLLTGFRRPAPIAPAVVEPVPEPEPEPVSQPVLTPAKKAPAKKAVAKKAVAKKSPAKKAPARKKATTTKAAAKKAAPRRRVR